MYLLLVASHVLAAIIGFGTIFAVPVIRSVVAAPLSVQVEFGLARRVLTPAMTWSLVSGLLQVGVGPRGFGELWIDVSLTLLVVLFAIAGAGLARTARRSIAGDVPIDRALARMSAWWRVSGLLVIVVVVLMVTKPG